MTVAESIVELWKSIYTLYFPKFGVVKSGEKSAGSASVDKEGKPFRYNFPGKPKKGAKCILIHPDNSAERAHAIDFSEFAEIKTTIGEIGNLDIELNDDTVKLEFLKNFKVEITKTKLTLTQTLPPLSFTFDGSTIKINGDIEVKGKLHVTKTIKSDDDIVSKKEIIWNDGPTKGTGSKHIHPTPVGPSGPQVKGK